jgi:hypothetical protein
LKYQSQYEQPAFRLLERARKIRRRFGRPGEWGSLVPCHQKPRYMHWRRYRRLERLVSRLEEEGCAYGFSVLQAARPCRVNSRNPAGDTLMANPFRDELANPFRDELDRRDSAALAQPSGTLRPNFFHHSMKLRPRNGLMMTLAPDNLHIQPSARPIFSISSMRPISIRMIGRWHRKMSGWTCTGKLQDYDGLKKFNVELSPGDAVTVSG